MSRSATSRAALLLFFLFFFGWAVTVLAWIDLRWTHQVLVDAPRADGGRTRQ